MGTRRRCSRRTRTTRSRRPAVERQHEFGVDVELVVKLGLPLLGEVRRAQHCESFRLARDEQLLSDECRLDGLADSDVVGDEEPDRVESQRHEQRDELVRPRLDRDGSEGTEWSGR